MTSRLDRLEEMHLVARLPEPNDRRSLKIQLTQKGMKLVDEIIPKFVAGHHAAFELLGREDSERLVALLDRLSDGLAASTSGTIAGDRPE